jgi:hypothetical protein
VNSFYGTKKGGNENHIKGGNENDNKRCNENDHKGEMKMIAKGK